MVHERARACVCETIEDEAEGIERIKNPTLMYDVTFFVDHDLPSELSSAESVSENECEPAGMGHAYR